MTRSKKTAKPEGLPMEAKATAETADIIIPETITKITEEAIITETASFPISAGLFPKTVLPKRKSFLTAFRNINAARNGISLKAAYIIAAAGSTKPQDASSAHIRWNPEIRNMPPLGSVFLTSSNTVLPPEGAPKPDFTAVTAAIAALRLCARTALGIAFAETAAAEALPHNHRKRNVLM